MSRSLNLLVVDHYFVAGYRNHFGSPNINILRILRQTATDQERTKFVTHAQVNCDNVHEILGAIDPVGVKWGARTTPVFLSPKPDNFSTTS